MLHMQCLETETLVHSETSADQQRQLERVAAAKGHESYRDVDRDMTRRGFAGATDWGRLLVRRALVPMTHGIEELFAKSNSSAGPRYSITELFRHVAPEKIALITVRSIIDDVFNFEDGAITSVFVNIGDRLKAEILAEELEGDPKGKTLLNWIRDELAQSPNGEKPDVRIRKLERVSKRYLGKVRKWKRPDKAAVGFQLAQIFENTTGLVRFPVKREGRKTRHDFWVSPRLDRFAEEGRSRLSLLHPFLPPMSHRPRPWTSIDEGGYLELKTPNRGLMKRTKNTHCEELRSADLTRVFSAINRLQDTAWRVNPCILECVQFSLAKQWHFGPSLAGGPPEKPLLSDYGLGDDDKRRFKQAWAEYKIEKNKRKKARRPQRRTADIATDYAKHTAIYFPYQLDFRGRVYAVPSHLNPQSSDLAKGLLEFAVGKPLGEVGEHWLMIHAANCYGIDKVPFEERIAWTRKHLQRMAAISNEPYADLWWTEADDGSKAWQFLAACRAIAGYVARGRDYVCHLPIAIDGSNNGLQHFAAMLRDEVCATSVNVKPSEQPHDVYQEVADRLIEILNVRKGADRLAGLWLVAKVTRKLCKRPVMILPYGGQKDGVRKYIVDYMEELPGKPFGKDFTEAANYMRDLMWDTMNDLLPGPRKAMSWLKEVAQEFAKGNQAILWRTPSGFVAYQKSQKPKVHKVRTYLYREQQLSVADGYLPAIDKKDQAQQFSPNFVHSLDAANLVAAVNAAGEKGVTHFACVHDSFGTHACDVDTLRNSIREEFASMYRGNVLADLKVQLDQHLQTPLNDPPEQGVLNIWDAVTSDYLFA